MNSSTQQSEMDLGEILISEVQKRPALWNLRGKAYHNRAIVDGDWKKVAEITGLSVEVSKVRWKNLRDHFRKELLKQQRPNPEGGGEQRLSKWMYFESLLFLKNVLKPRRSKGKPPLVREDVPEVDHRAAEAEDADDDGEDSEFSGAGKMNFEEREQQRTSMAAAPTFNLTELPALGKLKREREWNDSGATETAPTFEGQLLKMEGEKSSLLQPLEDDDLNFLKTLLPYMKSLPPIRKLMVRSQFQNLLVQEMINLQDNNGALPTPSMSVVQLSPGTISSPSQE